jgi:hypothetical protein
MVVVAEGRPMREAFLPMARSSASHVAALLPPAPTVDVDADNDVVVRSPCVPCSPHPQHLHV